ncbi:MAG: hypothetical protein ACE1Z6_05065, partial [Candidatus Methylomirabilales bacterium]
CYRPGVPELSVEVRYDGKSRELLVDIEQTQHIDEQAPAYRFTLPIFVRTENEDHTFDIEVQQQQTSYRAVLDSPPTIVAVDPYLHVLKKLTVQKPQPMWTAQALEGPSIAARHEALQALGDVDSLEIPLAFSGDWSVAQVPWLLLYRPVALIIGPAVAAAPEARRIVEAIRARMAVTPMMSRFY